MPFLNKPPKALQGYLGGTGIAPSPPRPATMGCPTCWVRHYCMGQGNASRQFLERMDSRLQRPPPFAQGDYLYRAEDPCLGLYIVQIGLVRQFLLTPDGHERVLGFYMGADLLGLEALDHDRHRFYVQALDTTRVCLLPREELPALARDSPMGFHQLLRLMAYSTYQGSRGRLALQDLSAECRVAGFLLRLAERYRARHFKEYEFPLRIPRRDMASYLGLTRSTVSRVLSQLVREGCLTLRDHRRVLRIQSLEGLKARAKGCETLF